MKRILSFAFVLVLILGMLGTSAFAATHEVGANSTYKTVQAAVNAAQSGDTIYVTEGTYNENFHIDKSITITADPNNRPTINGRFEVTCPSGGSVSIQNLNFVSTDDAVRIFGSSGSLVSISCCNFSISTPNAACVNLSGTVGSFSVCDCVFTKSCSGNVVAVNTQSGTVEGTLSFARNDASGAGRTIYVGNATNADFVSNTQGRTKIKLLGTINTVTFAGAGAEVADWSGTIGKVIVQPGTTGFTPSTSESKANVKFIDGTKVFYPSLEAAVDAVAQEGIVELLTDYTGSINAGEKKFTIIKNGNTMDAASITSSIGVLVEGDTIKVGYTAAVPGGNPNTPPAVPGTAGSAVENPNYVPATGSERDTALMITLLFASAAVFLFTLRKRQNA